MAAQRLSDFIRQQEQQLAAVGIDNPALDARLLVAHILKLDRAQMLGQSERVLTADEGASIRQLIERRMQREPVARILGEREFWSLPFRLNEATLEPRPDSETIIRAVMEKIKGLETRDQGKDSNPFSLTSTLTLLDLGTGSGCLLLSLLHELPNATGLGIDIAPRAVEQAQSNAEHLSLAGRATFIINDWLNSINKCYDIIVSNPPYIAQPDISSLRPEVRDFDPLQALDGGTDGLDIYRYLVPQLPARLNPGGFAVFEVGQGQAETVRNLFAENGFATIAAHKDYSGIERCVIACT